MRRHRGSLGRNSVEALGPVKHLGRTDDVRVNLPHHFHLPSAEVLVSRFSEPSSSASVRGTEDFHRKVRALPREPLPSAESERVAVRQVFHER